MVCSRSSLLGGIALALRVALGGVFVYSAWAKLSEPWALFAMAVDAYGILPQWAVVAVARGLPWFELLLGVVLVSGFWRRIATPAAAALLLGFFGLLLWSYARGLQIECGCFGFGDVISPRTLLRDGLLAAAALTLAALSFRRITV